MYLVHAELRRTDNAPLPSDAVRLILDSRGPDEGVEHVVVHAGTEDGGPLVGLFVVASGVEEAERVATRVCLRALDDQPELAGFALTGCAVRLVPGFFDLQFRQEPGGQDMPGPS
ncbi:hypothetical protein ACFVT5_13535 [Streptomyces sp. NPDC058001]|uniref:hypothetical protein n=1 Tax=Streptomyces sp. NPDC058001 TaxID=3346300 RepID=UPI0036E5608D